MWWMLAWAWADGPSPAVQIEWTEGTCADKALLESAQKRAVSVCAGGKVTGMTYQYREAAGTGCVVWAHVWCDTGGKTVSWAPPGEVVRPTLYDDTAFRKLALSLGEGTHDLASIPQREGGTWSRKAGSIRVPAGWKVRLCADGQPDRCSDVTGDVPDLGAVYVGNDRARIVTVTRGALGEATIRCPRGFEHDNFTGKFVDVCDGLPDLRSSSWDNTMSSILVPPGWVVKVCDGVEGVPPCAELSTDTRRLSETPVGADKASSVVVVRRPGP